MILKFQCWCLSFFWLFKHNAVFCLLKHWYGIYILGNWWSTILNAFIITFRTSKRSKHKHKLHMSFSFYTMICCFVGSRGFTFIYIKRFHITTDLAYYCEKWKISFNAHNDQLIDTVSLELLKKMSLYIFALTNRYISK